MKDDQWKQDAPELTFEGRGKCLYKCFIFICNKFAKVSNKAFFTLSLWGIVCRILRYNINLIYLGIRL